MREDGQMAWSSPVWVEPRHTKDKPFEESSFGRLQIPEALQQIGKILKRDIRWDRMVHRGEISPP